MWVLGKLTTTTEQPRSPAALGQASNPPHDHVVKCLRSRGLSAFRIERSVADPCDRANS